MFYNQLPLLISTNPQQTKREHFRLQIRHRQIQQLKKQIRFKYYQLKDPNDYELLKNINLTKILNECKYNGLSQQRLHAMFLYASSRNSDHLFQLLDQKVLQLLIHHLATKQVSQNKESDITKVQVNWDRKIFWILTNYTSYSQTVNGQYLNKLMLISDYLFKLEQRHPYMQQTEQNIILSLSNLFIVSKNCRYFMKQWQQFFIIIMNRIFQLNPSLFDLITKSTENIPKIVFYYSQLLNNLYTAIQYTEIQQMVQQDLVKLIVKMMNAVLNKEQFMTQENKKLFLILLDSICMLFGNSLDRNPQIIITHNKQIRKMGSIFQKFVKTQKQSPKSNQIIVGYLKYLRIVYGPNISQEIEREVSKFYVKHFENHVGKVCQSMFRSKHPIFYTYTLQLLQSVLMEQYLVEYIFSQYLPLISHIFDHIQHSSYAIKKQALMCLVNLLKSTLYQESCCIQQVLQIILANKISDILAYNLWAYVDNELNLQILLGIQMLLQAQKNQYGAKLRFWEMFEQAGGVIKMQKIQEQSGNDILRHQIQKILHSVKVEDEPVI